jgi:urease accessory protein
MSGRTEGGIREPRPFAIRLLKFTGVLALAGLSSTPALAHLDPAEHGSFAAGFSHPLLGLDHILAMVAVGLWAALLGGRSIWLVPTAFVGTMLAGFVVALSGLGLPFVEPVIAASVVVIGLLAMAALQVPTRAGMAMVGFFAFFHGYAHGGELGEAGALSFSIGFAIATALLHAAGVGLGLGLAYLAGGGAGRTITRVAGGLTALAGLWLVAGA